MSTPRCLTLHVDPFFTTDAEGVTESTFQNVVQVNVPKGQVLYVVSAEPNGGTAGEGYSLAATNEIYDVQRAVASVVSIVIVRRGEASSQYRDRPGAGFTMGGGATEKVNLYASGAGFWVVAWVGDPSKIPGLAGGAS